MKKPILTILLVILVSISFAVRFRHYNKIPPPGLTLDEYSSSWVGLSLLQTGQPIGISGLPDAYPSTDYRYINIDRIFETQDNTNPLAFNSPWFDHPPLLGLITGGCAYLWGARDFSSTPLYLIRQPMVIIGSLTPLLVFVLAYLHFGFGTAFVSSFLYSLSPLVIVGSRLIQAENGLIPTALLALIFLTLFYQRRHSKYLILAAMFTGLATLFKLSGIFLYLTALISLTISTPRPKLLSRLTLFLLFSLPVTLLFLTYGLAIDPSAFFQVLRANSSRYYGLGPEAIFNLFRQTKLTNTFVFTDPWIMSGWIAFIYSLSRSRLNLIHISLLSYLATYLFFGSYAYGWYAFPFYPFLFILLGRHISSARSRPHFLSVILLLLIPIGYFLSRLIDITSFQKYANPWRFLIPIVIFIPVFIRSPRLLRPVVYIILALAVILSTLYFFSITPDTWLRLN